MSTPHDFDDPIDPRDAAGRHERLCAYLFGELEEAGRARVEAELALDPELAAERARLEATIDLVRGAAPEREALSPAARAALSAAARDAGDAVLTPAPSRRALWPPLLAAAAVLALLAGAAALAMRGGAPAPDARGEGVARLEAREHVALDAPLAQAASDEAQAAEERPDAAADPEAPQAPAPAAAAATVAEPASQAELAEADLLLHAGESFPGSHVAKSTEEEAKRRIREWKDETAKAGAMPPVAEGPGTPGPAEPDAKWSQLAVPLAGKEQAGSAPGLDAGTLTPFPLDQAIPEGDAEAYTWRDTQATSAPGAAPRPEDSWFLGRQGREPQDLALGLAPVSVGPTSGGGASGSATSDARPEAGVDALLERATAVASRKGLASLGYGFSEPALDADEREAWCGEILRFCRVRPSESPSAMFFRCWGDNPFELARLDPLSTFAADVDTASYALARAYLERGYMPTKEQIRTEEFVNSFDSGVPAPVEGDFALDLEMAPSLFGPDGAWMLRVVVRGREVDAVDRPPLALTFVVDVSGSMQQEDRLGLVQHALRLLASQLDAHDSIAIVAFSDWARLVLPMTSAGQRDVIESAIFGLSAGGSTNAEAGLRMGYEVAGAGLTAGAQNRVVLLSDGVANVGQTQVDALLASVAHQRAKGIYLNTIGVGMGNHNDALLEQLADKGDGVCNYVDSSAEAKRALVDRFTGALVPIARDVKIQVELDPGQVERYRLLGYENRAVADARFRDDAVDAGEVGAGHQVTALYEIVRSATPAGDGPLAIARVRYEPPFAAGAAEAGAEAGAAREIQRGIAFSEVVNSFEGASAGYRKAVLVAQLAEVLRRSVHARGESLDRLVLEAAKLAQADPDPAFQAFARLLAQRSDLIRRHLPADDALARALDELVRRNYLAGQLERLLGERREPTADVLEELRRENEELEQRIRDLILEELERR